MPESARKDLRTRKRPEILPDLCVLKGICGTLNMKGGDAKW